MNKQIEALKMAVREMSVYAMQHANDWLIEDVDLLKAINACKEALAEAESESSSQPVAWLSTESKANEIIKTHPATWQSLSDDEIKQCATKLGYMWTPEKYLTFAMDTILMQFARAIEQALKEKNHPCK